MSFIFNLFHRKPVKFVIITRIDDELNLDKIRILSYLRKYIQKQLHNDKDLYCIRINIPIDIVLQNVPDLIHIEFIISNYHTYIKIIADEFMTILNKRLGSYTSFVCEKSLIIHHYPNGQ